MSVDVLPRTRQELAAEILLIAEKGEHFDMTSFWMTEDAESKQRRIFLASDEPECGTTMCIAGLALHLTGWDLVVGRPPHATPEGMIFARHPRTDVMRDIPKVAAEALGLTTFEATQLFYTSNTYALILLRQLANGAARLDFDAAEAEYGASYAND